MWPQVSACLQAPRRKFEEAAEAAAGSQHGRQSWVGWRPGQLVCAACAASSSAGCGAARYRGFSSYNTKGSARLASAEVRRKCIMLTVYFALIGFRPSFWINLGLLQLLWFLVAVNAEELFQGRASDSRLQWGKQRDHAVVTRGRQPANSTAVWGSSHGHIPDEASWTTAGSTR